MISYPGRIIKQNETDPVIVRALADALRAKGQALTSPDGVFDAAFKAQIKLYQSLHTDNMGNRLEEDGKVGSLTWGHSLVRTISTSTWQTMARLHSLSRSVKSG
ncbi:peptidoglycan-binding domain-containing protein [Novosphingobium sediminicola]|uniref:Peptidoglycan hydrolase-like protein with peptidoglycan-binding domain n=1 Tax=Novosphingobium sediminicola TaxID=563162 RepID=A0A7W6G8B8_9SPHN|nr:peptidoglycan-binding domain-containing protein [Novosphingobium sediminicola]MBB3957819.1 peptidoglycan hydrolase-like protein with peptidoglycan-binding domain [Novosphingobium sediminicola]